MPNYNMFEMRKCVTHIGCTVQNTHGEVRYALSMVIHKHGDNEIFQRELIANKH